MTRATIKLRRGIAAKWAIDNPILASGEPGLEIDTGLIKIGDGVKRWTALPYFLNAPAISALVESLLADAVIEGVPGPEGPQGPPGPGSSIGFASRRVASGNVIGTSTSGLWVVCSNGVEQLSVTIAAAAGDLVEVTPRFLANPGAMKLDLAVVVNGAPVYYLSSEKAVPDTDGESSFYLDHTFVLAPGPAAFLVTEPMLSNGSVTVALMRRSPNDSGQVFADNNYSFKIHAKNYGAPAEGND